MQVVGNEFITPGSDFTLKIIDINEELAERVEWYRDERRLNHGDKDFVLKFYDAGYPAQGVYTAKVFMTDATVLQDNISVEVGQFPRVARIDSNMSTEYSVADNKTNHVVNPEFDFLDFKGKSKDTLKYEVALLIDGVKQDFININMNRDAKGYSRHTQFEYQVKVMVAGYESSPRVFPFKLLYQNETEVDVFAVRYEVRNQGKQRVLGPWVFDDIRVVAKKHIDWKSACFNPSSQDMFRDPAGTRAVVDSFKKGEFVVNFESAERYSPEYDFTA
ncbi:hypothetical protein D5R38_18655 [Serratia marcescens]|uniref:hypothetical protein n=1 Tax=Serratia marcescens TaxID=615 RepID=UPI00106869B3|nr:hypothetical protein [Serratia marcescens]TEW83392.1 hypothetical protein D5R38_18655 [Serratia marcescens]